MRTVSSPVPGTSTPAFPDQLISDVDAAHFLGLPGPEKEGKRQLQQMRRRGDGPPFVPVAHKIVRYSLAALRKWIELRTVANTSEARELKGVACE